MIFTEAIKVNIEAISKKGANSLKKIEEQAKSSKVKRRSLEGWKLKAKESSKADLG